MIPIRRLLLALLLSLATALPAQAAVTITFWSHELGNSFPHAFFTLRGTPDAGGAPVDLNYGFTARSLSPAILMGPVAGKLDIAKPGYMAGSDAQFSVVLTDAQYADVLALVTLWGGPGEEGRYKLDTHNCVHFVQEAARRSGLTDIERPGLMKKPRSFLKSIAEANAGRVTIIAKRGRDYLPTLAALAELPSPASLPTVTPDLIRGPASPSNPEQGSGTPAQGRGDDKN